MPSINPSSNERPPAYAEVDPTPGSYQRPPEPPTCRPESTPYPSFGPTPLNAQPLIPYAYHDARSPYSIAQADLRARWRLINGCLWAFGLWTVIGLAVGTEITDYDATRSGATRLWGILSSTGMGQVR